MIEPTEIKKPGGLERIPSTVWKVNGCRDPGHSPPSHICIPDGFQYRHICPACGAEQVIMQPQLLLKG